MENHQDTRNWSVDKERLSAAMQSLASRRGMSLVEIMVVIAIILMLLSVITFGVFQTLGNARQDTTKLTMGKMAQQIEIYMRDGMQPYTAIVEAGTSRVRPVAMAAFTTVLGMIPLAFDVFFGAMAVTIMGGLTVATLLTLLVVPVLYATLYNIHEPAA